MAFPRETVCTAHLLEVEIVVEKRADGRFCIEVGCGGLHHGKPVDCADLACAQRDAYDYALQFASLYAPSRGIPAPAFKTLSWPQADLTSDNHHQPDRFGHD